MGTWTWGKMEGTGKAGRKPPGHSRQARCSISPHQSWQMAGGLSLVQGNGGDPGNAQKDGENVVDGGTMVSLDQGDRDSNPLSEISMLLHLRESETHIASL